MDVYDLLFDKRSQAIINAKKVMEIHEKRGIEQISVESNPSTQVYNIVEEILNNSEESI